jgi:pSer/pThr/pTyr-binding forkhead associated (FHA) protein
VRRALAPPRPEVDRSTPGTGADPPGGTRAAAGALLRIAAEGGEPVAGPHLIVLSGPAAGERLALGDEQTLGRGAGADVRIPDPLASRLHARVRIGADRATVEDLGSKNGLEVNGRRFRGARTLVPGDEIALGGTTLAFADPVARAARPAPRATAARTAGGTPGLRGPWLGAAVLLLLCAFALALAA